MAIAATRICYLTAAGDDSGGPNRNCADSDLDAYRYFAGTDACDARSNCDSAGSNAGTNRQADVDELAGDSGTRLPAARHAR